MTRQFTDRELNRKILDTIFERTFELELREDSDPDSREVEASLSSEFEVTRFFGTEILEHSADAVDLARAEDGLPMLFGHDHTQPIGVVEDVRIEDKRLKGRMRFSNNDTAEHVWRDVRDGFLKNVSIGYRINKWEQEADSDQVRVTHWAVHEASIVSVPADPSVGVNRDLNDDAVDDDALDLSTTTDRGDTMGKEDTVVEFKKAHEAGHSEGRALGEKNERARIGAIYEAFALPGVPRGATFTALRDECVDNGYTVERAQSMILALMGDADLGASRTGRDGDQGITHDRGARVEITQDAVDKVREMGVRSFTVRAGIESDKNIVAEARRDGLVHMSMLDVAAECLRASNVDVRGLSRDDLLDQAFAHRAGASTTSDFANVLENSASKSMMVGWDEAPETWNTPGLARIGSLPDFKTASRPGLGNFSDLEEVGEDGEIKTGTMVDLKESYALKTYAKKLRLTRQVIINDDLNAFAMSSRKMGRAASRLVGDRFWNAVTANAALDNDGVALFHTATHGNLQASGAAPSVAQLDLNFAQVEAQTDPSNVGFVGGEPKFIIGPPALRGTIETIVTATFNPANANNTENRFAGGRLTPVIEPRLTADSATAWYLFKDGNQFDTIELGFLNGVTEPFMRNEQEWDTGSVAWVVRIDVEAKPLDYRNVHKDPGA